MDGANKKFGCRPSELEKKSFLRGTMAAHNDGKCERRTERGIFVGVPHLHPKSFSVSFGNSIKKFYSRESDSL